MDVRIRDLAVHELPELAAALASEGLPTRDLGSPGQLFFRCTSGTGEEGFAGLEIYGEDALLRSVFVPAAARGRAFGRRMVERVLERAGALGVRRVHLLTTTAPGFFARLGFIRADRGSAPAAVAASSEFGQLCPASAVCMVRELP